MLKATNISINYDDTPVVRGASLRLEKGKVVALLGPNGAGKTTLLRALNGGIGVASGAIELGGKPLGAYSRREIAKMIAVIAQETETKFPVTVYDFVVAGRFAHGGAFGWETDNDRRVAVECLAMCDLAGYETKLMNRLSGGERQRAVLARALATGAQILLLDEPTANLDLAHQVLMFRLLRERCGGCESSAVVITHDINLAAEFADEIVLLKNGAVVANGAPEKVLTEENLQIVFGIDVLLDRNPASGKVRVSLQIVR